MQKSMTALQAVSYAMVVVFIFSAVVQHNDPEPIRWMAIYGAAAVVSLLFAIDRLSWKLSALLAVVTLAWAFSILPYLRVEGFTHMFDSFQMMNPAVEFAREFGGLMIITIWMALLTISLYRREEKAVAR